MIGEISGRGNLRRGIARLEKCSLGECSLEKCQSEVYPEGSVSRGTVWQLPKKIYFHACFTLHMVIYKRSCSLVFCKVP